MKCPNCLNKSIEETYIEDERVTYYYCKSCGYEWREKHKGEDE